MANVDWLAMGVAYWSLYVSKHVALYMGAQLMSTNKAKIGDIPVLPSVYTTVHLQHVPNKITPSSRSFFTKFGVGMK